MIQMTNDFLVSTCGLHFLVGHRLTRGISRYLVSGIHTSWDGCPIFVPVAALINTKSQQLRVLHRYVG